jgi:tRNA splicing ligase
MYKEVLLIAGLPGCGKTTYLCQMFKDGWLVFDDYKALAFRDCSKFRDSRKFRALVSALRDEVRCVVADINFCKEESRQEAESDLLTEIPDVMFSWLFFENDPSACETNIRSRNRPCLQRELGYLREYSASYHVPQGAVVIPVWQKSLQGTAIPSTGSCP